MGRRLRHVLPRRASLPKQMAPHIRPSYYFEHAEDPKDCIYCRCQMEVFDATDRWKTSVREFTKAHLATSRAMEQQGVSPDEPGFTLNGDISDHYKIVHMCKLCGWWVAVDKAVLHTMGSQFWAVELVSPAVLKELDLGDVRVPMDEVRRYLIRRFENRASLHPRLFEETVASVFRDHGYRAAVTAYSKDGGIDVVLDGPNGERIGVQVKRRSRSIEVEQIRAFLGALTLGGYTRGIFVSSSDFQKGAVDAAVRCSAEHVPIELVGAKRFLDMLGVAQLSERPDPDQCGFDPDRRPRFVANNHYHLNPL